MNSKYELVIKTGQDLSGELYEALDKKAGTHYSAKVSYISKNEAIFLHEKDFLSAFNHPSILKYIDYVPNFHDRRLIITEFASKGTLNRILKIKPNARKEIGWNSTTKLINIYGIASAMSFLHSNDIILRNLNPNNIVLDDDLHPKLTGFNLSGNINDLSNDIDLNNFSPKYVAPEIYSDRQFSKKGDVYAFSMIVYEIITEKRPFEKINNLLMILKKVENNNRPDIDEKTPICYKNLIQHCWSQNPDDRPTFDEILNLLKSNPDFITKEVDEEAFYNYEKLIDTSEKSFDLNPTEKTNKIDLYSILPEEKYSKNNWKINDLIEDKADSSIYLVSCGSCCCVAKEYKKETTKMTSYELSNLIRSLKIMNDIKYPSIANFSCFSPTDLTGGNHPVVFIEYAEHGSLRKWMEKEKKNETPEKLDSTQKFIIIYGIAKGMNYLHKCDIIHRDLKPENILLDENLYPKISDFDSAKKVDDKLSIDEENSDIKGTMTYLAPEVLTDDLYSKASDVYAFGIVVYEIISGEEPYNQIKSPYLLMKEVSEKGFIPHFDDMIPDFYKELTDKCTSKESEKRPSFDDIIRVLDDNAVVNKDFLDYISIFNSLYQEQPPPDNIPEMIENEESLEINSNITKESTSEDSSRESDESDCESLYNGKYINYDQADEMYDSDIIEEPIDVKQAGGNDVKQSDPINEERINETDESDSINKERINEADESDSINKERIDEADESDAINEEIINENDESESDGSLNSKPIYDNQEFENEIESNDKSQLLYSPEKIDINLYQNEIQEENFLSINIPFISLERYDKNEEIGSGNFATVYKIIEKDTDDLFAAKIINTSLDECTEESLQNIEREIHIISTLNHPTILKFIGYNSNDFDFNPNPTIVTELASNNTLENMITLERYSCGSSDWNDTMKLINIYGIAAGMEYLHSQRILHRDLKTSNILLDDHLFPKIADFGFSKKINNQIKSDSCYKGTVAYTAPEVFKSEYSEAGDVYSFAIIVYEIMTNEEIYKGMNIFKLMNHVLNGFRLEFTFKIPDSYQKLIEACWMQEPEKRPTFKEIVQQLKTDTGFITENVDEEEFLLYIDQIEDQLNDIKNQQNDKFKKVVVNSNENYNNQDPKRIKIEQYKSMFLDLSKFELGDLICKEEFCKHYKIINKETKSIYSGKFSKFEIDELTDGEIKSLTKELQTLTQLNYPSLIQFIGFSPIDFNNAMKPVIVTKLASNGSLRQLLDTEKDLGEIPEWNDTKKLITIFGIASGMLYLHLNNIILGNLQPENIYYDEYLYPKIGDFGLSKINRSYKSLSFQSTQGISTSISYLSPEVLQFNDYSEKSDVYSFGMIVYEIITKETPFSNINNLNKLYNVIVNESIRPKIDENIPDCYKILIQKCWASNPIDRPTFKDIVENLKSDSDFINDQISIPEYNYYVEKAKISVNIPKESKIIERNISLFSARRTVSHQEMINKYIESNELINLMEYLHEKCDDATISSVFDAFYQQSIEKYITLCKAGIKINDRVAHQKYACYLATKEQPSQQDHFDAVEHLLISINKGYHESYFFLGRLLHESFHDDKKAFQFAKKGSDKGEKYSKCLLGHFISKGIGTEKDLYKGVEIMLESNANDYYDNYPNDIGLYFIHLSEEKGDKKSSTFEKEKAFKCFEKAFNHKHTTAAVNNYGLCFLLGIGVEKDINKAKEIFEIGIENAKDIESKQDMVYILSKIDNDDSKQKINEMLIYEE